MRPLALLQLAVLAVAQPALAYDVEIDSETVGQGYQLAATDGTLIDRRRLDQYLGLHVWNLGPKEADGTPARKNQFYFSSSMRFETDFGSYPVDNLGIRRVRDELGGNRFELLFAYAGARDLFGFLDAKLGRQILIDQFEWTSFDGLDLELKTPYYLALEAYAGARVDGALPFDSPLYRPDGTALSSLSVHDTDWKPTVGVILKSFGVRDLDARLSYHRTFSPAQSTLPAEAAIKATDGTSEERVAWSVRGRLLGGKIVPWFGVRYDLLNAAVDHIEAGARLALRPEASFSAEYLYSYPTFDGDSIWNLFVRREFDDVRVGWDGRFGPLAAYARLFLRFFFDEPGAVETPSPWKTSDRLDWGGTAGVRMTLPRGYVRLDGYADGGYGGQRYGGDASARLRLYRDLLFAEGRVTYVHFEDDARPIYDHGDSVGVQLGARVQLGRGIAIHLLAEDNVNRYYTSQLRFYAVLDLAFLLGTNGFGQARPRGQGTMAGMFGAPSYGGGY